MPPTLRPAALDPRSAPPGNREDESFLPDRVPGRRRWVRALRAGLSRHAAPAPQPGVFAKAAAPKAGERYRLALQETDHIHSLEMLIRSAPLRRCVVIAVVSPKGGAGKTTITALLGTLLAELRRDPVLGLDANPDFGNLRDKLAGPDATVTSTDDLAEWLSARPGATPADLASMLGMGPHGLRYLPTPTGSIERMVKAADFGLYRDLIARLRDYEGIILVDCGTGLLDPPVRAALSTADQILLVTDSSADTARLVVKAARYLPTDTPTWLVANKMPDKGAMVDLDQVVTAIPQLRGVTIVPEQRLAENIVTPSFDWSSAPEAWREPVREVAARLANNWRSLR
jgi:MinD-like ATPase involved in chromosome partitioning or flagellar assembly